MERIEVTLADLRNEDDAKFANLVDLTNLSIFIDKVLASDDPSKLGEFFEELLEGK